MGRAPAFWTEENFQLVNENFIAVSVQGSDQGRQDAVGQFCRDADLQLDKYEGVLMCVTAGGKILARDYLGFDLRQTLEKFEALPASERAPGAVKVAERVAVDPQIAPPPGGLILKVYSRALMHDGGDKLRYVTGKDLWYDAEGKRTLEPAHEKGRSAAHQAQPDHMWLTAAEWKALLPANARVGDKIPLPTAVANRILLWHLNPLRFYGRYGSDAIDGNEVRAGELNLTVDSVEPATVRLRLKGFAKFGKAAPAAVLTGKTASLDQWGYEPRVLGFLEYDPREREFTRFDIVALGEYFGRLGLGNGAPSRIGLQPLGIVFELVKDAQPADRIPPGRVSDSASYFDLSR
ncbi:MAG: hypothetical protein ABI614_11105 [Planctomycetota bacterium]